MRLSFFTLLFLLISVSLLQSVQAQEIMVKRSTVVENYKGKPNYIHFVAKGETLTAISKAYQITIDELIADNPAVAEGLKADMVLRIPVKTVAEMPEGTAPKTSAGTMQSKPAEKPKELPQTTGEQNYILYQVKKQETLYGISKQYNVTVDDIINANPGFDGLKDGMEIKIPKKGTIGKPATVDVPQIQTPKPDANPDEIIVKSGETLYGIAKANNTTVDNLIELNPQLIEGLKAGMVLRLRKPESKTADITTGKDVVAGSNQPVPNGACYDSVNRQKTYKVALILPFLLSDISNVLDAPEQKDPSEFDNFNYFQFYAGFMLAADSLEKYGLKARIQVLDGDKLNDTLTIRQTLRKPGMDKLNLIVGPVYANSFAVAARFARKNEIGIINPLSRRENIVDGNPFVIKAQVSPDGIARKLAQFITRRYPDANIIAVRNDAKELKSLVAGFSALIKNKLADRSFNGSIQEVTFSTDLMAGVTKKLKANSKNIIIFFSNNKSIVPNFVSLLNPLAKSHDIILMGMDGWEDLELETEFLVNLNYHQLTSAYIDYDSEAVKQFVTRFRAKYGAVPLANKHAFLGYDVGWYFLTALMWYGDSYITCLAENKGPGLQYNFNFTKPNPGDGYENQDITIVKLLDYEMIKVE